MNIKNSSKSYFPPLPVLQKSSTAADNGVISDASKWNSKLVEAYIGKLSSSVVHRNGIGCARVKHVNDVKHLCVISHRFPLISALALGVCCCRYRCREIFWHENKNFSLSSSGSLFLTPEISLKWEEKWHENTWKWRWGWVFGYNFHTRYSSPPIQRSNSHIGGDVDVLLLLLAWCWRISSLAEFFMSRIRKTHQSRRKTGMIWVREEGGWKISKKSSAVSKTRRRALRDACRCC